MGRAVPSFTHLIVVHTSREPVDQKLFGFALLHSDEDELDCDLNWYDLALLDVCANAISATCNRPQGVAATVGVTHKC